MASLITPRTVTATRFLRKLRGASQAHLLQADDGSCYVTKFQQNPQGRRVLINELLSWLILEQLGIASPEAVFVNLTEDFLCAQSDVYITLHRGRSAVYPGRHFGSAFPVNPSSDPVYDFLPDALLHKVHNICEILGALVFDMWVSNSDGRQVVFFRSEALWGASASEVSGYLCRLIDNGYAFHGNEWAFHDCPGGLFPRRAVYRSVESIKDFEPWLDLAMSLPEDPLWHALDQVPQEWLREGEPEQLQHLISRLIRRQSRLSELLVSVRAWLPDVFPKWTEKTAVAVG